MGQSHTAATTYRRAPAWPNQRLYDKAVSASDIVSGSGVQATTAGKTFVHLLNSKVPKHSS